MVRSTHDSETPATPILTPHLKLGEEVTRYLRDSILTGEYRSGQRIQVEELASRLGVSAMPSREALTTLLNEGLLIALPRRGYRVADITSQDIEDVFAIHSYTAGLLGERAAKLIQPDQIAFLRELNERCEKVANSKRTDAQKAEEVGDLNFEFHRVINEIPDAPRLRWFLRAALRYVPRHFYQQVPTWASTAIAGHAEIVDALERRDAKAARRLLTDHIQVAGRMVVDHLRARGFFA
jgi:DNA-binding GntR family transcriptional regulator